MPALFVFLLKVNLALLVFCAGYYLVLRRLTFYTLNRVYLVGAIVFTSVYPKINLSAFIERHPRMTEPVQAIAWGLQSPAHIIAQPHYGAIWHWLTVVFWLGVAVMAIRLGMQFLSLARVYLHSQPAEMMGHKVRIIQQEEGPFSFWTNIYINPKKHDDKELKAILMHEQVHVDEWHTVDILLAELSTIFYWFNPGIWLMKKAVKENIEFITDRKILQKGVDAKQYQYSLVNVSFGAAPQAIVNHFNISTIKKRIIMMNAKRSSKYNLTRYAILVPAAVALLLVFTISRAALRHKIAHYEKIYIKSSFITPVKQATPFQPLTMVKLLKPQKSKKDTVRPSKIIFKPDTAKKSVTIVMLDSASRPVNLTVKHSVTATLFIVDGKFVSQNELMQLNNRDIVSITVGKQPNSNASVLYIRTKNGPPMPEVKAIKINGNKSLTYQILPKEKKLTFDTVRFLKDDGRFDTVKIGYQPKFDTGRYAMRAVPFQTQALGQSFTKSLNHAPTNLKIVGWESPVSLIHLSDKLIIIDGKIATKADLKKLSAFDIDRITLKTDEDTESLYGDKAKKGIVFIVTRRDR